MRKTKKTKRVNARTPRAGMKVASCRVCGCTEEHACRTMDGACGWVEPDLCSACVPENVSYRVSHLQFLELSVMNARRCEDVFHAIDEWSPTDWACAMAGEAGEACNLIKKLRRGEFITKEEIGKELADVVIYADLLAQRLKLSLARCVQEKFNEVSFKRGSVWKL